MLDDEAEGEGMRSVQTPPSLRLEDGGEEMLGREDCGAGGSSEGR